MPPSSLLLRWSPHATGFSCPAPLRPTAWTPVPVLVGGRAQATVVEVSADGVVLAPLDSSWPAPAGAYPDSVVVVTVPFGTVHELRGSAAPGPDGSVVVTWTDPPVELLADLAAYLLVVSDDVTPAQLRAAGLPVRTAMHAVGFGEASGPADAEAILALRLRSHQHEGHMIGLTAADLRSPFDAYAQHIVCRHAGRIVGYVRAIMVEGDAARSQYVTWSGHEIPAYLWDEGFVEGGAAVVDPEYQRAGLFVPLVQRLVGSVAESGMPHMVAACPDEHLPMYRAMGFERLETREVEPRPGWRFLAHLIVLDIAALVAGRRAGRLVTPLRDAARRGIAAS